MIMLFRALPADSNSICLCYDYYLVIELEFTFLTLISLKDALLLTKSFEIVIYYILEI